MGTPNSRKLIYEYMDPQGKAYEGPLCPGPQPKVSSTSPSPPGPRGSIDRLRKVRRTLLPREPNPIPLNYGIHLLNHIRDPIII